MENTNMRSSRVLKKLREGGTAIRIKLNLTGPRTAHKMGNENSAVKIEKDRDRIASLINDKLRGNGDGFRYDIDIKAGL